MNKHFQLFFNLLAYFLLVSILLKTTHSLEQCEHSPRWRVSGVTFPNQFPTKVKFVALLKASCNFCRTQAIKYLYIYKFSV